MKYQLVLSLAALVLSGGFSKAQIQFGPLVSKPGESVRMVSHSETPGGTTERALRVLETSGVRKTFEAAITAAADRSRELAGEGARG